MFIRTSGRLTISLLLALILVGVTAATALAWNATCGSGEACVWRHANFGVPKAATDVSEWTYTDDFFPNTQTTLNDEVSSIRNRFNVKDVIWYFDAGYSGTSFCLNAGYEAGVLNAHDNQYSSHVVASGSSC